MRNLIISHRLEYRTTAAVIRWESREVLVKMAFNLPFCLDHESQACPVTHERSHCADGE